MSRTLKLLIVLLLAILVALNFNISFATEDVSSTQEENIESVPEETSVVNETPDTSLSTLSPSSVTSVSPVNSYEQANLELNNILSIILIAIGVLLILFAIAILIKLK